MHIPRTLSLRNIITLFRLAATTIAVCCVSLSARSAFGDLVLSFSADGSTSDFEVVVGDQVEIPIYLRQLSVSGSSPDITIDPLESFGIAAILSGGNAIFTDAAAASPFDSFDFSSIDSSLVSADLIGNSEFGEGQSGQSILLGTFRVQGLLVDDVISLDLFDPNPGAFEDFITEMSVDNFDADVFSPTASATISVVAVPEPSSMAFFGIVVFGLAATRRRTRSSIEFHDNVREEVRSGLVGGFIKSSPRQPTRI
ncbi:MAG: PEP-CTERM sorting domain-containing protein [Planctomycetota bacterium]